MDLLTWTLTAIAVGIALVIARLMWPSPPELDGERWFKVMLCTLLRGRVEAKGGSVQEWEEAVLRYVPYHPAGRCPERKILDPLGHPLASPALPGEQALVEGLARVDGRLERWARMYDGDEMAIGARLDDPAQLGAEYDPSTWLGPDLDWDALANIDDVGAPVDRGMGVRWVLVTGTGHVPYSARLLEAVRDELGGVGVWIPWSGLQPDEAADQLVEGLETIAASSEVRLVLVCAGEGIHVALRAMVKAAGLRDQVLAVLSLGGPVTGFVDMDGPYGETELGPWMDRWFCQDDLDTEMARETPYFSLQWLDRELPVPGVERLPMQNARFPAPRSRRGPVQGVYPVDLGPLPVDETLPMDLVARALVVTTACWIRARGGRL